MSATAELQARAGALLSPLMNVQVNDGGSLGFDHGGALFSLQAMSLATELDVLSMVGVLAWDLNMDSDLHERVLAANEELEFGALNLIERDNQADVILRYTFPAAGLSDEALTTMLLLVISAAQSARARVLDAQR